MSFIIIFGDFARLFQNVMKTLEKSILTGSILAAMVADTFADCLISDEDEGLMY